LRWEVRAGAGPHRRLLASSPHNSPLFCPSFPPSLTRTYLFRFRYWMTARSRTALVLTPQYPGTRALLHRAQVAKECPLIPGRSHTITPSQFNCAVYKRRRHAPLQKFHFIKSWFRFVFLGNHEKLVIVFFFCLAALSSSPSSSILPFVLHCSINQPSCPKSCCKISTL